MPRKPKLFKDTSRLDCGCRIIYYVTSKGCLVDSEVKLCKQHRAQARLPLPKPLFYVESVYTYGWDDACWTEEAEGQEPVRTLFSSRRNAQKDIEQHVLDIRAAVRRGYMHPPGERRTEFRVVPWDFAEKFAGTLRDLIQDLSVRDPNYASDALQQAHLFLATYHHSLKI
jgi:hypothetical protein